MKERKEGRKDEKEGRKEGRTKRKEGRKERNLLCCMLSLLLKF
jgi:hypothetical protein